MDEKITLEIRTRMDQLCSRYPASRELTELKEELVADLTEAVAEKINEGQPVASAIDTAMSQLGDIDSLLKEVTGTDGPQATQSADTSSADEAEQTSGPTIDLGDQDVEIDHDGDEVRIGGKNGLRIRGDQVIWHGHTIVDNDRVNLGKLVQVDGDHVSVADGLVDVNGDDVRIAGAHVSNDHPHRTFVESLKLVNTRTFDASGLTDLVISYPNAQVKLSPANGDDILVNEYMSRDNPRYLLRADRSAERLTIQQGERPRLWSLHVRTEIFLPARLASRVQIEAGNGSLEINDLHQPLTLTARAANGSVRLFDNSFKALSLEAANGSLKLNQTRADQITATSQNGSVAVHAGQGHLNVSSHNGSVRVANFTGDGTVSSHNGTVRVSHFTGQLTGQTANGTLIVQSLIGGGQVTTRHGSVDVDVADLTQDLKINGAGNVTVTTAPDVAYQFDGKTHHGHVRVPSTVTLSLNDDQHKIGTVGTTPAAAIQVHTDNGNVVLK